MGKLKVEGSEVEGVLLGRRQDGNYPTPPEGKMLGIDDEGRPCYIPGGTTGLIKNLTLTKVLRSLRSSSQH